MGDPLWHTLDLAKDASVEEIIGVVARDPQDSNLYSGPNCREGDDAIVYEEIRSEQDLGSSRRMGRLSDR